MIKFFCFRFSYECLRLIGLIWQVVFPRDVFWFWATRFNSKQLSHKCNVSDGQAQSLDPRESFFVSKSWHLRNKGRKIILSNIAISIECRYLWIYEKCKIAQNAHNTQKYTKCSKWNIYYNIPWIPLVVLIKVYTWINIR